MKLITTGAEFQRQLKRLFTTYANAQIGVAWASASTVPYQKFAEHKGVKAVIGIHFYQTHPDVLDDFADSEDVKFILQPQGVFHPKLYLFWDKGRWEAIIGSGNFTRGAMEVNTELSTLISVDDGDNLKDLQDIFESYAASAKTITKEEAKNYRQIWKAKQDLRDRLVDCYGSTPPTKSALHSTVMSLDWSDFLSEIRKDEIHGFDDRLELMDNVRTAFSSHPTFNDIPFDTRLGIAGLKSKSLKHSEWFGSMTGAGTFYNLMNASEPAFSLALAEIPSTGTVTKSQYASFIAEYLKAYPNGRDGIGTATRLLSMKRPDQFLCVDGANREKLAKDVGMKRADQISYERYWEEIVVRLMDSPWWRSPPPGEGKDLKAWKARAAMLDAIFYEPS